MKIKFWNANAINLEVQKAEKEKLQMVGLVLSTKLKAEVERPNHTGKNPSLPGEPPKKVTANLHDNIAYQVQGSSVFVGVREVVKYALGLEYGTSKMAPRPWLRPVWKRTVKLLSSLLRTK